LRLPDPLAECKMSFASLTTAPDWSKILPETVAVSVEANSALLVSAHARTNCLNTCLPSLEATVESPLLLGAGQGRSSDLQAQKIALLLTRLPILVGTVMLGLSFLLTAAGQSRTFTGFPFKHARRLGDHVPLAFNSVAEYCSKK
jgi:hypothetical protein